MLCVQAQARNWPEKLRFHPLLAPCHRSLGLCYRCDGVEEPIADADAEPELL